MTDAASDEDDYMSAAFLADEPKAREATYSQRRAAELRRQKEAGTITPLAQRAAEQRDAGLAKTIADEDNVGFRMLQKMGYKPGTALGKEVAEPVKPTEEMDGGSRKGPEKDSLGRLLAPIPVQILPKSIGLGVQTEVKKREREFSAAEERKKRKVEREFKDIKRREFEEKKCRGEVAAMRREVETLDETAGKERSEFWPELPVVAPDDEVPKAKDPAEELHRTALSNEEILALDEVDGNNQEIDGPQPFPDLDPFTQREQLIDYLRGTYHFCHYCGVRYETEEEMAAECPGEEAEDHE